MFVFLRLIVLAQILLVILAPSAADAFKGYAECQLLEQAITKNHAKLELDEAPETVTERFGLWVPRMEDGTYRITSMHPILSDKIFEDYDEANIIQEDILEIDGLDTAELSQERFDEQFDDGVIEVRVTNYDQLFRIVRADYSSVKLKELFVDVDNFTNISTKSSSFDATFSVNMVWKDDRLSQLANMIALNAPMVDGDGKSFFCTISKQFIEENKIFLPTVRPSRFMTQIDEGEFYLTAHYEEASGITCTDESYFDDCSDTEKKFGVFYYELSEGYVGKVTDRYQFSDFPFDRQFFRITLQPDTRKNHYSFIEFDSSGVSEMNVEVDADDLYSPEWEFLGGDFNFDYVVDSYSNQYLPVVNFDYEAKRKSNYFIFKLMLPITFLLVLSWMVYFVSLKDLQSRLTISIVCFLSLIAYNFIVDSDIPKLGYLTFIDKFILVSYIFSGAPTIQTVLLAKFARQDNVLTDNVDHIFRLGFIPAYILAVGLLSAQINFS